jgi:hypothetical protein
MQTQKVFYFYGYDDLVEALRTSDLPPQFQESIKGQLRQCATPLRLWECIQINMRSGWPHVSITFSPRFMNTVFIIGAVVCLLWSSVH